MKREKQRDDPLSQESVKYKYVMNTNKIIEKNSKTENENKKINKKIERAEEIASEIMEDPEGYISYYKTKDAIKSFRREKIQRKYRIDQKVLRLVIDILKDNKKDIEDKIL